MGLASLDIHEKEGGSMKGDMRPDEVKRVLFIAQYPPPVHGASLMNLYTRESTRITSEFDCRFINLATAESIGDIEKAGIRKFGKVLQLYVRVARCLIGFKPHLCYITPSPIGLSFLKDCLVVVICKVFRRKILVHLHGKGIASRANKSKLMCGIYRSLFSGTHVICLSSRLSQDVADVYSGRPFILPNGIPDLCERRERQVRGGPVRILFLSNFIASKGVLVLVEALALLQKRNERNKKFLCRLVGADNDMKAPDLQDLIEERGLGERVSLMGPKFGAEKADEFAWADILVFPTYRDCFPLVILEAMMHGRAVVSTYEGAIPEIIDHGRNGILCRQRDVEDLAQGIEGLLGNRESIRRLGMEARKKFSEQFDFPKFESKLADTINQCLV